MEVTTVSPSPTSPTEGPDLCGISVTNVAIHSVRLLICLCGLAGNGAVLWLIVINDITQLIFDLALADFLFLLFAVPSTLLFLVEEVSCSPILPLMYLSFLFQLSMVSYYLALFWLTESSLITEIFNLFQLCFHCNPPVRLWWWVSRARYWAFFAVITVIPTVTSLCPSHEQEHCRTALISVFTIILLLFAIPMVISYTVDFIKGNRVSQQQLPKKRDIVVVLTALFILLLTIWNFLQQLGYIIVPSQVVFLLTCITSSIKPFIYFLAGRCWWPCSVESLRNSLQRVFE